MRREWGIGLLPVTDLRGSFLKLCIPALAGAFCSLASWVLIPSTTENAAANGDTRTLHLYHTHTGETIDATFRVDGHYDPDVLRQLNHFLRDWRNNDETSMDPRLFDAVWEAYRTAGATDRVQIYSAYRSPETNAMLRRRSRAVAEHSQHMLGKAMDTTMPGFPMERIREAGMKLQHGGVGWYPSSNFVHLDVGGVRSWPRMSYDQLARIFPDGKTVHIASNGQTLPGYEEARAEIAARGGTEIPPSQSSGGFFAWLFGGGGNTAGAAHEDEEDRRTAVAKAEPPAAPVQRHAASPPPQVAQAPAPQVQQAALAYAGNETASSGTQPLDGRVHVGGVQVASLEQPAADAGAAVPLSGVLPLPPRRPADLAATPDIPLPPVRPDTLSRVQTSSIRFSDAQTVTIPATPHRDPIGSLITATASGVPMIRRSSLPAIITEGAEDRRSAPSEALAFASADSIPSLRSVPVPMARPADLARSLALRASSRSVHKSPQIVAAAASSLADVPVAVGPQLTGLRRAAREMAGKASL